MINMKNQFKKILFEENPEGLIEMIVKMCGEHIGRIDEVHPLDKGIGMLSFLVSASALEVGKQIALLDFKRNCTELIKYPVSKVIELDKLQFQLSDFEQAGQTASFPITFDEFIYIDESALIERVDGIVKMGEKSLYVWWDSTGGASIGDLRVPEFDLNF